MLEEHIVRVQLLDAAQALIEKIGPVPGETSCYRCEHYKKGICSQYAMEVPAEHIDAGCQKFESFIPF